MKVYKRIREGLTIEDAKQIISQKENVKHVSLMIKVFKYSRDACGNPIAYHECNVVVESTDNKLEFIPVVNSGYYRQQTGGGKPHNDALYCLRKLGYKISEQPIETTLSYDCFKILNI